MHFVLRIWGPTGSYGYDSNGPINLSRKVLVDTLRSIADDIENQHKPSKS